MTLWSCFEVARVNTMIALPRNRRETLHRVAPVTVTDLEVDALGRRIRQGARDVELSPTEHIVLYTLAASAGAVVTYAELAAALGLVDMALRANTIARHVSTLRRKLRDDPQHPRYIETVVGFGYGIRISPRVPLGRTPTSTQVGRPPPSDDP